jgi:hypothetical protein
VYDPKGDLGLLLLTGKWWRLLGKHILEKITEREFPCAVSILLKYAKNSGHVARN